MQNPLRVLDAARSVVEEVDQLLDADRQQLLRKNQLRESAGSIAANIREAYGQRRGRGRAKFFIHARGSAEETDEHLRANFNAKRIADSAFWRLHNRIAVIVRMLGRLIDLEDNSA
jgi:four helix bundle protein